MPGTQDEYHNLDLRGWQPFGLWPGGPKMQNPPEDFTGVASQRAIADSLTAPGQSGSYDETREDVDGAPHEFRVTVTRLTPWSQGIAKAFGIEYVSRETGQAIESLGSVLLDYRFPRSMSPAGAVQEQPLELSDDAKTLLNALVLPQERRREITETLGDRAARAAMELIERKLAQWTPKRNLVITQAGRVELDLPESRAGTTGYWDQLFYFSAVHEPAITHWQQSIEFGVEDSVRAAFPRSHAEQILSRSGGRRLMAWGCKATEHAAWEAMKPGDLCLSVRLGGVMDAFTIVGKADSRAFASQVWGDPEYCRIYFLVDRISLSMRKDQFLQECGYADKYIVQGTKRLAPERLVRLERIFGTLEEWVGSRKASVADAKA